MSNLTPDDMMQPVYCTKCRVQVPRADSNANGGLCGYCFVAQQKAIQQQDQDRARAEYTKRMKSLGYVERKAVCLYCGERALWISQGHDENTSLRQAGAVVGCLCFLPALLLALAPKRMTRAAAYCEACEREYYL